MTCPEVDGLLSAGSAILARNIDETFQFCGSSTGRKKEKERIIDMIENRFKNRKFYLW